MAQAMQREARSWVGVRSMACIAHSLQLVIAGSLMRVRKPRRKKTQPKGTNKTGARRPSPASRDVEAHNEGGSEGESDATPEIEHDADRAAAAAGEDSETDNDEDVSALSVNYVAIQQLRDSVRDEVDAHVEEETTPEGKVALNAIRAKVALVLNGALSTAREMLEIFFESPLFNETMSEEERSELLAFLMKSAVDYRHHKSLQVLLAYGADPYCAQGLEAPLTAIGNVQDSKTLEVLVAHGAWMQGCRLSLSSTRYGDEKLVGDLLRSGADANVEQPNERSVLHRVVGQHRYCSAQLLIEEGFADVDARDNRGRTPLMLAASVVIRTFGPPPSQKIAKLLLDAGADLHAVDNYRRGVLHCTVSNMQQGASHQAVGGWNPDCLRLFLERGANPNLEDDHGRMPLTTLVIHARCNIHGNIKEMLKLLLQAGADPFIRDNRGLFVAELLQRSETGLAFMQENPVYFTRRDPQTDSEQ